MLIAQVITVIFSVVEVFKLYRAKSYILIFNHIYFLITTLRLMFLTYYNSPYEVFKSALFDVNEKNLMIHQAQIIWLVIYLILIIVTAFYLYAFHNRVKRGSSKSSANIMKVKKKYMLLSLLLYAVLTFFAFFDFLQGNNLFLYSYNAAFDLDRFFWIKIIPYYHFIIPISIWVAFGILRNSYSKKSFLILVVLTCLFYVSTSLSGSKSYIVGPLIVLYFMLFHKKSFFLKLSFLVLVVVDIYMVGNRGQTLAFSLEQKNTFVNMFSFQGIPLLDLSLWQLFKILYDYDTLVQDGGALIQQYGIALIPKFLLSSTMKIAYVGDAVIFAKHYVSVGGVNFIASLIWAFGKVKAIFLVSLLFIDYCWVDYQVLTTRFFPLVYRLLQISLILFLFIGYGYGVTSFTKPLLIVNVIFLILKIPQRYIKTKTKIEYNASLPL